MAIDIKVDGERRNFVKASCCLGLILTFYPKKAEAWLPVLIFIGRVFARSAIKKIGQYIVRSSATRTVVATSTRNVIKTGIIASTIISEAEATAADLTEDEIRKLAKRMNYPDDNYALWLRDEPSASNELHYEVKNNTNKEVEKIIRVVLIDDNNKVEDSAIAKIRIKANSSVNPKIFFDVSNTKKTGAKRIVFLDSQLKPEKDVDSLAVIIEDYEKIRKVLV